MSRAAPGDYYFGTRGLVALLPALHGPTTLRP